MGSRHCKEKHRITKLRQREVTLKELFKEQQPLQTKSGIPDFGFAQYLLGVHVASGIPDLGVKIGYVYD